MSGGNNGPLEVSPELRAFFTPDQLDELVAQFQMSDTDGSGSIDEQEFRQLLTRMSLVVSDAEAGDLVDSIDTDGNGLIEFPELVSMVVRIKKGDERFAVLRKFLETLDTTPISLLQREADKFGLRVSYQLMEERQGTESTPAMFLMELEISGKWCGPSGSERLEAAGRTTREAKFKVAEAGLIRLKKLKPGLAFDLGFLPPEWESWLFDNIERGGNPKKVMKTLREKGFSPANNALLMQKISARISSRRLRTKRSAPRSVYDTDHPESVPQASHRDIHSSSRSPVKPIDVLRRIDPQWVHWCQQEISRGIDGRVVLRELICHGYEPDKNPSYTQSVLRTHKSRDDKSSNGPSAMALAPFSFWNALEAGNLADVELFVHGGQDVDATQQDATTRLEMAPLHLVCKHGHLAVVKFLLSEGASVNALDSFHRSPLLIAARHGFSDVCEQLLRYGASIFVLDNLHNTALHMAAFSGSSAIAAQVLRCHNDRFRLFLARLPQETGHSYEMVMKAGYEFTMKQKLRDNQRRRFHRSWLLETAQWIHSQLFGGQTLEALVPAPQKFFMDYLVEQYADELTSGAFANQDDEDGDDADDELGDNNRRQQSDDPAVWLSLSHMTFYVDRCLRNLYKHLLNKQGRTALHVSCDENLVCTHERVIHLLAERHGCSPLLRDHSGSQPVDLVLACRGRPGSPKGDAAHEQRVAKERGERRKQREACEEAERVAQRRKEWQDAVDQLGADYEGLETLARMRADVKARAESLKRTKARHSVLEHVETEAAPIFLAGWAVYSEPQSRNRLFENTVSGFVQHQVPAKVAQEVRVRLAWKEKMETHARFVERNRLAPEWELHRINGTDVYFFYNRAAGTCQWLKPQIQASDKEKAEMAMWKTKRVFEEEEQLEDEPDRESLALVFSGSVSPAIMKNAVPRRILGGWRECVLHFGGEGGATFYVHEVTQELSIDKPEEVLRFERYRYAHGLLQARSEAIEEHANGWERFYEPVTKHTFYYNSSTGDCVHDSFATRDFLLGIRKPRKSKTKASDETSLTEKEVLQRRLEEREWRQALVRARQHDELVVQQQKDQAELAQTLKQQDVELEEDIQHLEESVAREHLGGQATQWGIDSTGDGNAQLVVKDGAYVASRFARELEVFLSARRNRLLTSEPPPLTASGAVSSRRVEDDESARSLTRERVLDDLETENARIEDVEASIPIRERRRVSRVLVRTASRLARARAGNDTNATAYTLVSQEMCRWGCERWLPRCQAAQETHETRECERRLMICRLGCGLVREARQWHSCVPSSEGGKPTSTAAFIYDHESERKQEGDSNLCSFRIVSCPRSCGVWEPHVRLATHMKDTCVKRPVGDLCCRLDCGEVFRGDADSQRGHDHELLALEQARIAHEQDACPLRLVECTWTSPSCKARILARDRKAHRKAHVLSSGVVGFLATGVVHEYKVPRGVRSLKIQAWGAGGGSGMLKTRACGRGGGGAFVQGECAVNPSETLYIVIGEGGSAGRSARMVEVIEEVNEEKQDGSGTFAVRRDARMETVVGVARGGAPGGGAGHAGNCETACGGGGGFTSIYRKCAYGIEYLVIAGGGGGGGTCRGGGGGAGLRVKTPLLKPGDDERCGQPGGDESVGGGAAGVCEPLNAFCRFQATGGESLQGGDGAEYGGGGGGGLFGGGGGGFAPGIVGGGGGGSSYVNSSVFDAASVRVEVGSASGDGKPGGVCENPPPCLDRGDDSCIIGEGGAASVNATVRGSHGGVRFARPGFFNDMKDMR